MSKLVSSCFYFTSFFQLWISISFIDAKSLIENTKNTWTERISIIVIIIASIISAIVLLPEFISNSKEGLTEFLVKDASDDKTITSEYLLSCILPLLAFDFTKWDQVVLFLIFFVALGFLCIRHNHFSANILLEMLGYRVFTCELEDVNKNVVQRKIISRRMLSAKKGNAYI
ncbi:hypothetical protein [Gardnerella vaginalis]|uniref:hypothetical protein n=1 Tax=Gardnerella vaginalis TaxID=2702 RepID=UPI0039EF572F